MPRFFFTMIDGPERIPDPDGSELADAAAAREEALRALGERVRYELPDGDRREFAVEVSDESGQTVVRANLSLFVEYGEAGRESQPEPLPFPTH